ncbi:hypothetical protein LENED_006295 [Lentinula edodes]|uniref:Uncharacterized protein n=1 Tax=Lentinula edodes TaxID=5353 RepID=A0A1Q3EBI6_LENED|nr:hypothetical protein F5877DRAFT_75234 [Lentinula edodes]GAW04499.1 hypothetical protein LENED_006295 [Lentinula edodes]
MSLTVQSWPGIALILWAYLIRITIGAPIPVTSEGLGKIGSLSSIAPMAFAFAVEASGDFMDFVLESESGLGLESLENSREDILDAFDVQMNINDAERILALGEPEPFYLDFDLDCDSDTDAFEDEDYVVIDFDDYIDVDGDEVYDGDEDYVDIREDESYVATDSGDNDLLGLGDEDNIVADLDWDKVRTETLKFNQVNRKRSRRQLMNPYIPPYKIV